MKLIKGYFTLSNLRLEKKLRKEKLRRRSIKLSTNKIFLSDGEFKHTNDKVIITLYLYNRQKYNYLYKLKKRYVKLFVKARFLEKLNLIKKIFNKNVELNLINLKYFYFNSDIFSQPLVLKLRKKRNLLRYLKACVRKVKIKKTNEIINNYFFDLNKLSNVENVDIFNNLLLNLLKQNEKNYNNNTVVKN